MSDPLSDAFRANVEAVRNQLGLTYYQLGKIVTPNDPKQCRTQMLRGMGFTLSTVYHWSERLGIRPDTMLTEGACGTPEPLRRAG